MILLTTPQIQDNVTGFLQDSTLNRLKLHHATYEMTFEKGESACRFDGLVTLKTFTEFSVEVRNGLAHFTLPQYSNVGYRKLDDMIEYRNRLNDVIEVMGEVGFELFNIAYSPRPYEKITTA